MREAWIGRGKAAAFAGAAPVAFMPFGQKKPPFSLLVDLRANPFTPKWWEGAGTLALMLGALGWLAPGIEPLPGRMEPAVPAAQLREWEASGVGSLATGSASGQRMVAGRAVQPILAAPERLTVEQALTVGADGLGPALVRAGASYADAVRAHQLARASNAMPGGGTSVEIELGRKETGRRSIIRIAWRADLERRVEIVRGAGGLVLRTAALKIDSRPLRIRGRAGDGLYWALRSAGASSASAAEYLKALSDHIDVGAMSPDDRFDLVLASRKSADGQGQQGMLLYAAIDRTMDTDLQLVRWTAGGKPVWVDLATLGDTKRDDNAMQWPVSAPITSRFGLRVHPILRFARMHRGIDFGAHWGTPIRAAADGQVARAGWAGGYGRQVRIDHGGGLASSYSHMSSMAVAPGAMVMRGQVIGYVGTSGLSTGPHLHYEVYRGGVAVDPMSVRFVSARPMDPGVIAAIRKRAKQLAP